MSRGGPQGTAGVGGTRGLCKSLGAPCSLPCAQRRGGPQPAREAHSPPTGTYDAFTYTFIQEVLTEHLLCAWPCAEGWDRVDTDNKQMITSMSVTGGGCCMRPRAIRGCCTGPRPNPGGGEGPALELGPRELGDEQEGKGRGCQHAAGRGDRTCKGPVTRQSSAPAGGHAGSLGERCTACLLYTSDAADDYTWV